MIPFAIIYSAFQVTPPPIPPNRAAYVLTSCPYVTIDIPIELVSAIFVHLTDPKDVLACKLVSTTRSRSSLTPLFRQVCRQWNTALNKEAFWKLFALFRWDLRVDEERIEMAVRPKAEKGGKRKKAKPPRKEVKKVKGTAKRNARKGEKMPRKKKAERKYPYQRYSCRRLAHEKCHDYILSPKTMKQLEKKSARNLLRNLPKDILTLSHCSYLNEPICAKEGYDPVTFQFI